MHPLSSSCSQGAGWWAAAVALALSGHLVLVVMLPEFSLQPAAFVYPLFIIAEKPFLLTGMVRFLNLDVQERWFWIPMVIAELWTLDTSSMIRTAGYSAANAALLACLCSIALRHRHEIPGWTLHATALASGLLALHWLTAPYAFQYHVDWFRNGFVLGSTLTLMMYFSIRSQA